jgi:hypothetical protein
MILICGPITSCLLYHLSLYIQTHILVSSFLDSAWFYLCWHNPGFQATPLHCYPFSSFHLASLLLRSGNSGRRSEGETRIGSVPSTYAPSTKHLKLSQEFGVAKTVNPFNWWIPTHTKELIWKNNPENFSSIDRTDEYWIVEYNPCSCCKPQELVSIIVRLAQISKEKLEDGTKSSSQTSGKEMSVITMRGLSYNKACPFGRQSDARGKFNTECI